MGAVSTGARACIVVLTGIAVAAVLAIASGASAADTAIVLMLAAAGSLAAAAAGAVLLRTLRGRSLRTQVLAVAIATTVTMVVGVLVAAAFMLVSNHDVAVLAVVLVVAGSVAAGAALYLGDTYERDTRGIAEIAERLGDERGFREDSAPIVTGDLQRLAEQLAEVSARLDASRARERALDASRPGSSSLGSPMTCAHRSQRSGLLPRRSRTKS